MANVAERLYEHFLQHSLDFMLLFYLRHPNLMNDNSLCKKLSKCLKDFCVRDQDMSSVDFRTKFFNSLRAKLSPDFSLNPDADFYYAMGDGAKKTVLSLLDQDKWGLCDPYCFQTRGKCSTFFAYRRFEDGLAKVSDLLRRRRETLPRGENIHIEQVYEHCWGKDRFRKLFIDYEVEEAWYQGNRTAKQIELMARTFPRWLYMKLRDLKFVDADTEVRVVVKDKCRDLPSGRKVSFHFIFNVLATSTQHEWVCHRIFSRYAVVKKSITQDKVIPSEFYDDCAVGVDLQTLKGERGYSTPYSKKKEEDPDCVVRHREFHTIDGAYNKDLESVKDRGMVLYLASYTCPDPDTVTYSPVVLRDSEELATRKGASSTQHNSCLLEKVPESRELTREVEPVCVVQIDGSREGGPDDEAEGAQPVDGPQEHHQPRLDVGHAYRGEEQELHEEQLDEEPAVVFRALDDRGAVRLLDLLDEIDDLLVAVAVEVAHGFGPAGFDEEFS